MNPYDESQFIERTQDGMVLNQDRSRTIEHDLLTLTEEEKIERREWNEVRKALRQIVASMTPPIIENVGQALSYRMPPPLMGIEGVSRSNAVSKGRSSYYVEQICAWDAFGVAVNSFPTPIDRYDTLRIASLSYQSGDSTVMVNGEDEMQYLVRVLSYLDACNVHLLRRTQVNTIGEADRVLASATMDASGAPSYHSIAPVEGKSTQNLLLPITATAVAEAYNDGYDTWATEDIRNTTWHNVCQPLAQLFCEMKLNQKRFGVLTSATRTYFVRVFGPNAIGDSLRVCVSKAFLIGENNYLRAWAYFASEAKAAAEGPLVFPHGWGLTVTPLHEADQGVDIESLHLTTCLPFVYKEDLDVDMMHPLGYGRNGAAFRGQWKDEPFALKQFDTASENGRKSYIRECQAYYLLKDVWGILVPRLCSYRVSELILG